MTVESTVHSQPQCTSGMAPYQEQIVKKSGFLPLPAYVRAWLSQRNEVQSDY